ncbi:WD40/YVTN/BNR-like repeat-containing protein [Neobacillus sp. LXY-4]|uniref:WD40/YVTN/BNR-like repeat-containing protein n=1 Tax=Neobacillus sp. LXY-4 TaxID=3379826 RepID=UPI003EE023E1
MIHVQNYQNRFILILLGLFLVITTISLINQEDHNKPKPTPSQKVTKADINSLLPYTAEVYETDTKPDIIAYRVLFDFMNTLKSNGTIANAGYTRFTKLSGDENSFVVAVVFQVQLPENPAKIDYDWGKVQENRVVRDIVWKLTINKVKNQTYTITNIEKSTDPLIGLPPVESMEEYRKEAGIEEPSEDVKYEIKDQNLRITFNNGGKWKVVPVAVEELFRGDYNGPVDQLIKGSYIITPERTAFVLGGGGELRILESTDQGDSWNEVIVSTGFSGIRMRILGFTSDLDGYLILTGDRTMSSEGNLLFKTNDGGQSWYGAGFVRDVFNLVTDGGYINNQLGFISFGEYHFENQPPIPNLYRTTDGGANWERVQVPIPEEFLGYFKVAEIPTFNGEEGTLLVNQGSDGDYLGGNVLAKFTSRDQGKTWTFAGLVDPDGVLLHN